MRACRRVSVSRSGPFWRPSPDFAKPGPRGRGRRSPASGPMHGFRFREPVSRSRPVRGHAPDFAKPGSFGGGAEGKHCGGDRLSLGHAVQPRTSLASGSRSSEGGRRQGPSDCPRRRGSGVRLPAGHGGTPRTALVCLQAPTRLERASPCSLGARTVGGPTRGRPRAAPGRHTGGCVRDYPTNARAFWKSRSQGPSSPCQSGGA